MRSATPQTPASDAARPSNKTTRDGTRLSLRTRHEERRPHFLLVHELASHAGLWDGVATHLADNGFPSSAVDQRGHGLSQQVDSGFGFDTLSRDLFDVIEVGGSGPVVAVGHHDIHAQQPDAVTEVLLEWIAEVPR